MTAFSRLHIASSPLVRPIQATLDSRVTSVMTQQCDTHAEVRIKGMLSGRRTVGL